MAEESQLSSLSAGLQESLKQTEGSSDESIISLKGTIADPSNLQNVSNNNTALNVNNMTSIGTVLASSNLSLNLQPAKKLMDCAMNLEDRIMAKAQEKVMELLKNNADASSIASAIGQVQTYANTLQEIIKVSKSVKPKDLLTELAVAKGLQGLPKVVKIQEILNTFGSVVNNISDIISNLDAFNICSSPNYTASGSQMPSGISSPSAIPTAPPPTYPGATVNTSMNDAKDNYDVLMVDLRSHTGKDISRTDDSSYVSMITSVNTIALAYHDKLMKSTSPENDSRFASEFKNSINIELGIHAKDWNEDLKKEYTNRCYNIGILLGRSGDVVRAYAMRNKIGPLTGALLSTGITIYGGPNTDYTTFLDIKPEQRPPELTAYWQSRGYNIPSGNTYTNSAGKTFRIGTLNYQDAFKGPFGDRLISDFSCASTRVPIGSVLALKNPDGSAYNPAGKNPSGVYTVHDTGNVELTYNKVDVFTLNPEPYKASNMAAVQVFLVSRGTKEAPQYKRARERFG